MSEVRGLGREALQYAAATLINGLAGFAAIYLFSRLLPPAEYGYYYVVLSVVEIAGGLSTKWINLSLVRLYPGMDPTDPVADPVDPMFPPGKPEPVSVNPLMDPLNPGPVPVEPPTDEDALPIEPFQPGTPEASEPTSERTDEVTGTKNTTSDWAYLGLAALCITAVALPLVLRPRRKGDGS